MIKNYLLFAVLTLAAMSCNKDQNSVATAITSNSDELVSDRTDDCDIVEIRLDAPYSSSLSERREAKVYSNFTNLIWDKYASSLECIDDYSKWIWTGRWYPIHLVDFEQYELRYTYFRPCDVNVRNKASISIRLAGSRVFTFQMVTYDDMLTDRVYFYKSGCEILEGLIE